MQHTCEFCENAETYKWNYVKCKAIEKRKFRLKYKSNTCEEFRGLKGLRMD